MIKPLERKLSGGNNFVFPSETKYSLLGNLRGQFKEACKKAEILDGLRFQT